MKVKKDLYKNYSIAEWFQDSKVPKATAEENASLILTFKDIDAKFGRNNCVLFFMVAEFGINDCRAMLNSGIKQRGFVKAVIANLRKRAVTKEYAQDFKRNITLLNRKIDYVFRIIQENIKLTEYAPFFNAKGYEMLTQLKYRSIEQDEQMRVIKAEAEAYNAGHKTEIEVYMASVQDEIRNRDEHRAKVIQQAKEEKQLKKAVRKAQTAEINEMRKNAKKHASRERRILRKFIQH